MSTPPTQHRVWDLPVRIFHWSLPVLVLLQWGTAEFGWLSWDWHARFGYALFALLVFRVLWGVFGSDTARFTHFLRGWQAIRRYARAFKAGTQHGQVGHNPIGGWSVVLMMASLGVQTTTGLFASNDIDLDGPLAASVSDYWIDLASRVHRFNQNVLLVLIAAHVIGVFAHAALHREDLVTPMLSGRKPLSEDPRLRFVGMLPALITLALAATAVWAIVSLGG